MHDKLKKGKTMRVLVISECFPNSKQPNSGIFIAERLKRLGSLCGITVIAPVLLHKKNLWGIPAEEKIFMLEVKHPRYASAPWPFASLNGLLLFLCMAMPVLKLEKKHGFDIIDAHFAFPAGFAAVLLGKLFKKPVSITLRGSELRQCNYFFEKRLIAWALKNCTKVFAVSQGLKNLAVSLGVPDSKISVLENGVDLKKFRILDKAKARKRLGLKPDEKIILNVAGIQKNKGQDLIVESFEKLLQSEQKARLVFVGSSSFEPKFLNYVKKIVEQKGLRKSVLFAGELPHSELLHWYNAADVFCLASKREGCPNCVLESLACGTPIVATSVGTIKLTLNKDNGIILDNRDSEALSKALAIALSKKWERKRIRKSIEGKSWQKSTVELVSNFKKIVAGRKEKKNLGFYPLFLQRIAFHIAASFIKKPIKGYLEEVNESQWLSKKELLGLQEKKLQALVKHSFKNVPLYRHLMKRNGLLPEDIRTLGNLKKLPVVSKKELRKAGKGAIAAHIKANDLVAGYSSGSTGEPFKYYLTRGENALVWAFRLRAFEWAGHELCERKISIWSTRTGTEQKGSIYSRIRNLALREKLVDAFAVSELTIPSILREIESFKPKLLYGYTSYIHLLAKSLLEKQSTIKLGSVVCTGESFSENQRRIIEKAFCCKAFNNYGCEAGVIASECSRGNMHIFSDNVIVELVDKEGRAVLPGEMGEVVVTNLHNKAMPFIRYNTQDVAVASQKKCGCGREFPLLESVEGRATDIVVTPDKRFFSTAFFINFFEFWEEVKQFQVLQDSKGKVTISLVLADSNKELIVERVEHALRKEMGKKVQLELKAVKSIRPTASGKRRFVVSALKAFA